MDYGWIHEQTPAIVIPIQAHPPWHAVRWLLQIGNLPLMVKKMYVFCDVVDHDKLKMVI